MAALIAVASCGGDDATTDGGALDSGARIDGGTAVDAATCVAEDGRCGDVSECCDALACVMASTGDGFCVQPNDTCLVGAASGCCLDDADCAEGERCHTAECRPGGDGVCKPVPPTAGDCWSGRDCDPRTTCEGASLCPCNATCDATDAPGRCTPPPPTEA